MSQLTIYLDDEILGQIKRQARREHASVSGWVKKRITGGLDSSWPESFLNCLGSLKSGDLKRPRQLRQSLDAMRERL